MHLGYKKTLISVVSFILHAAPHNFAALTCIHIFTTDAALSTHRAVFRHRWHFGRPLLFLSWPTILMYIHYIIISDHVLLLLRCIIVHVRILIVVKTIKFNTPNCNITDSKKMDLHEFVVKFCTILLMTHSSKSGLLLKGNI